jgi:hypothetical protein
MLDDAISKVSTTSRVYGFCTFGNAPHPGERFENVIDQSLINSARGTRRRTLASRLLFILGVTGAAFVGVSSHEAAAQTGVSQIDTAHYAVSLTAASYSRSGTYQVGKPGSATFTVMSKPVYSIDKNHPWTLTLHNPPSDKVAYVKNVYTRADALISDSSVTFSVPFLAREEGKGAIEGVIDVRVCDANGKCDAKSESVTLAIDIAAAPPATPPTGK